MINENTLKLLSQWRDECLADEMRADIKADWETGIINHFRHHGELYEMPEPDYLNNKEAETAIKTFIKDITDKFVTNYLNWISNRDKVTNLLTQCQNSFSAEDVMSLFNLMVATGFKTNSFVFSRKMKRFFNNNYDANNIKNLIEEQFDSDRLRDFFIELLTIWDSELGFKPEISFSRGAFQNLAAIYLNAHSDRYRKEFVENASTLHAIHFYDRREEDESDSLPLPRATEYISGFASEDEMDEYASFDITNHGLGSGIYCVGDLKKEAVTTAMNRASDGSNRYKIVELVNFLKLYDDDSRQIKESDILTEISKYLQRCGDELKCCRRDLINRKIDRETEVRAFFEEKDNKKKLNEFAEKLCDFTSIKKNKDEILAVLLSSMVDWFKSTIKDNLFVEMPINFLIKGLGFSGIVSKRNDSFNRGLISFDILDDNSKVNKIKAKLVRGSPTFLNGARSVCASPQNRSRSLSDIWGRSVTPSDKIGIGSMPSMDEDVTSSEPSNIFK